MHSCIPASDGWIDRMYIGSLPDGNPVEFGKASKQNAVTPKLTTCSKKLKLPCATPLSVSKIALHPPKTHQIHKHGIKSILKLWK
jgi:hypothetical protein